MRNTLFAVPFAFAAFAAPMLLASEASATTGLAACGNINVSASAKCEAKVSGGCEAQCTPGNFQLKCEGSCSAMCNASFDAQCNIDCTGSCNADCKVNPGQFDCQGKCELDASASCSAKCQSSTDKTGCDGACKATYKAECSAKCNVVPPSATCDAKCKAKCEGGCTAKANIGCQVDCQGGCVAKADLPSCKAQCQTPQGALFCDGQYVDAGNNLQNCIDALNNILTFKVTVYGSAACAGNSCEAKGGFSCNAAPTAPSGTAGWVVFGACVAGLAMVTRRRRAA